MQSKLLGYTLNFAQPATSHEYDIRAGRIGAHLTDACRYILLHCVADTWGEAFCKALFELTGIPRQGNKEPKKHKSLDKSVWESPRTYNLRVRAAVELGQVPGVTLDDLSALAQRIANDHPIDPSPTPSRAPITKDAIERSNALLGGDATFLEEKITLWLTEFPDFYLEREEGRPTADSLARLIDCKLRAARDALLATL